MEECIICCEDLANETPLSCGHTIHRYCIVKTGKSQCCLCRQDILLTPEEQIECKKYNDQYITDAINDETQNILDTINEETQNILTYELEYYLSSDDIFEYVEEDGHRFNLFSYMYQLYGFYYFMNLLQHEQNN
jgi:hypothetical protein